MTIFANSDNWWSDVGYDHRLCWLAEFIDGDDSNPMVHSGDGHQQRVATTTIGNNNVVVDGGKDQ